MTTLVIAPISEEIESPYKGLRSTLGEIMKYVMQGGFTCVSTKPVMSSSPRVAWARYSLR